MKIFACAVVVGAAFLSAGRAKGQAVATDSVYINAQRLVSNGDAVAGRAIVDSMLLIAKPGTRAYAEAMFWRASLSASGQQAERDYRQIIVEYPLYNRVDEVLLRLAQIELTRGERDAALIHLHRLTNEQPQSPMRAAGSYWTARTLFEKGDLHGGCAAINEARALAATDDVELRNQIDFQAQQCVGVALNPVPSTAVDSTQAAAEHPAAAPPARRASKAEKKPVISSRDINSESTGTGEGFSVQVAAYNKSSQAKALASKLSKRGFKTRVYGTTAPFRVRVGNYPTKADAVTAQKKMKAKGISGFVVPSETR